MGREGKNLAVHSKGADAQLVAALDGQRECIGIVRRYVCKVCLRESRLETRDIPMSRGTECDGRIEELTAESPTEHYRTFTIHSPTK
jgi:hypothetical protein